VKLRGAYYNLTSTTLIHLWSAYLCISHFHLWNIHYTDPSVERLIHLWSAYLCISHFHLWNMIHLWSAYLCISHFHLWNIYTDPSVERLPVHLPLSSVEQPSMCAPGKNFPVGHPSQNCYRPSTLNLRVLSRSASGKEVATCWYEYSINPIKP
jgi:hypothetical protein